MDETMEFLFNVSSEQGNDTEWQVAKEFDMVSFLESLRQIHIKEFYGDHFHMIFVAMFVVCILGYITNVLNIVVFSRTSLANSMNLFLLLLSVSDIILITTQFAHVVHYFQGYTMYPYYSHYLFLIIGIFLESIFDNISNWMLATVGLWRFLAISSPTRCSTWFKKSRVKIIVILIFVFSILLALPMFLFITYSEVEFKGQMFYGKTFSDFANENDHQPLNIYWGFLLLRGLVPMIVMAVTTTGLIWCLCKSSRDQKKEGGLSYTINLKITVMLIILLALFLLSNLPDSFMVLVALISGGDQDIQEHYRNATDVIRVFMLANNSLSFFIYYGLGYEFSRTFNALFCRCSRAKVLDNSVAESQVGNVELANQDITNTK